MSATELERHLTELLNQRAEEAMNATNTDERLAELLEETRATDRRRPRRTWFGAVVARAAVTALAFWAVTRAVDRAEPQPAVPISTKQVATQYLEALATYDIPRAESYLSGDSDLTLWADTPTDLEGWRAAQAWNQAVEFEMALAPARRTRPSTPPAPDPVHRREAPQVVSRATRSAMLPPSSSATELAPCGTGPMSGNDLTTRRDRTPKRAAAIWAVCSAREPVSVAAARPGREPPGTCPGFASTGGSPRGSGPGRGPAGS